MREATASLRLLVRTAFDLSPRHASASFLEIAGLVLQRLTPVWVALVVGAATSSRPALAWVGTLCLALSLGVSSLFIVVGVNSRLRMLDLIGHHFDQRLPFTNISRYRAFHKKLGLFMATVFSRNFSRK